MIVNPTLIPLFHASRPLPQRYPTPSYFIHMHQWHWNAAATIEWATPRLCAKT
jgi:hypothetical protein